MSDDLYIQLIRDIESQKGRLAGHEDVCAQRYRQLDDKMVTFQGSIEKVAKAVGAEDRKARKLKDLVLYGTISVLFGWACWSAGQLWNQEPLRVQQAQAHQPAG